MQSNAQKPSYKFDYVYTASKTHEFKNVNVNLSISESGKASLEFIVEEEVDPNDIRVLIEDLQKQVFKKMKLKLGHECSMHLLTPDKKYYIDYGDKIEVYSLEYVV